MNSLGEPVHIRLSRVELSDIRNEVGRHWESLSGPTDSFLEGHVRESHHYLIFISERRAGFASIHGGNLITQFALERASRRFGQRAFQLLKKLEYVSAAFVPTCDEFYLSHALDDYRQLAKQAYFFEEAPGAPREDVARRYSLQPATPADVDRIREGSGEFFENLERHILAGEFFLTKRDGVCVGFGILERSALRPSVATVGMFTIEQFRCAGVGTATIALLVEECARRGLRSVSGCWYYNHASKRTLERAGMVSQTRLLRVEY
jgi:GNAT superfamily N-acetyltransferase